MPMTLDDFHRRCRDNPRLSAQWKALHEAAVAFEAIRLPLAFQDAGKTPTSDEQEEEYERARERFLETRRELMEAAALEGLEPPAFGIDDFMKLYRW